MRFFCAPKSFFRLVARRSSGKHAAAEDHAELGNTNAAQWWNTGSAATPLRAGLERGCAWRAHVERARLERIRRQRFSTKEEDSPPSAENAPAAKRSGACALFEERAATVFGAAQPEVEGLRMPGVEQR